MENTEEEVNQQEWHLGLWYLTSPLTPQLPSFFLSLLFLEGGALSLLSQPRPMGNTASLPSSRLPCHHAP